MLKNPKLIGSGIIVLLLTVLAILFGTTHSKLTESRENLNSLQSNIEERYDLRLNMVNDLLSVAQNTKMEDYSVFEEVAEEYLSREGNKEPQEDLTLEDLSPVDENEMKSSRESEKKMTEALIKLFEESNSVPELKEHSQWNVIKHRLEGINYRISQQQNLYNHLAKEYNEKITSFPSNMSAKVFGFEAVELFDTTPLPQS